MDAQFTLIKIIEQGFLIKTIHRTRKRDQRVVSAYTKLSNTKSQTTGESNELRVGLSWETIIYNQKFHGKASGKRASILEVNGHGTIIKSESTNYYYRKMRSEFRIL